MSMFTSRRRVAFAALLTVGAVAYGMSSNGKPAGTVAPDAIAPTTAFSMPPCTDLGDGEVWITWNGFLDCDLQPGQTFSYTDVPADGQADCEFYGGTFLPDAHLCYAVDF